MALFGSFSIGLSGYAGATAIIVLVAVLTAETTRLTVLRHLRGLDRSARNESLFGCTGQLFFGAIEHFCLFIAAIAINHKIPSAELSCDSNETGHTQQSGGQHKRAADSAVALAWTSCAVGNSGIHHWFCPVF